MPDEKEKALLERHSKAIEQVNTRDKQLQKATGIKEISKDKEIMQSHKELFSKKGK